MPVEHRYKRQVQFHETDLAGIVHFSWYFKYMEEAEHALWRSVGMSIAARQQQWGLPRVNANIDFKSPLKFEDEFEVHVVVDNIGRRSLRYAFTVYRGTEVMATGTMTSAAVTRDADGRVRSIEIPESVRSRLGSP